MDLHLFCVSSLGYLNDHSPEPADLKVLLDFCELDLLGPRDVPGHADEQSEHSANVQVKHAL